MQGVRFAVSYEGEIRKTVLALKNGNERTFARDLAALLVPLGSWQEADVITWVPTTSARACQRGYDHAELISRALGKRVGVPVKRLLLRNDSKAQQGRNRAERLKGPSIAASPLCQGKRVVVVDDVVTTGTTLMTCRTALQAAGALAVELLAVAGSNR